MINNTRVASQRVGGGRKVLSRSQYGETESQLRKSGEDNWLSGG